MCQSLANGGKRCFAHSSGTKQVINYVFLKTGIDKQQIYDIMKELRKEGRMLDAPTPEEVEKYFDLEEFKTKFDNTLTEKEKVAILKQLLAARSEAKVNPVNGGVFHAWKNALKQTVERFKRPLVALGLAGALAFSASGCAGTLNPEPTDPIPAPTSSVECSTENPGPWGDAVADEAVTDDYGTYCHVTVNPDASALVYDPSKTDLAALQANGFTEEDAAEAQKNAVTFVVEQGLDSQILDTYTKDRGIEWVNTNKDFFNPVVLDGYQKKADEGDLNSIVFALKDFPVLDRDGGPRTSGLAVQVDSITAGQGETAPYIRVNLSASAGYPAQNSKIVDYVLKAAPDYTEDQLKTEYPFLFTDSNAKSTLDTNGTFSVAYSAGNLKQISGSSTKTNVFIVEGEGEAPAKAE